MTKTARARAATQTDEPIGIVIAQGTRAEDSPLVRAYVWGPAPDEKSNDKHQAA
jgi:hypothetical protein